MLQATVACFAPELLPCLPLSAAGKEWMPWQIADAAQAIFLSASYGDATPQDLFLAQAIKLGTYTGVDENGFTLTSADDYYSAYSHTLTRKAQINLYAAAKGNRTALYYLEAGIE